MRNFILMLAVSGLFYAVSCATPASQPVKVENTVAIPVAAPADDAPRITLADAKKDFDAGTAVFVDVRAEAAFKDEHVKGAVNITGGTLDPKLSDFAKSKKIIVYCSWPSEHSSASLVSQLKAKGYENIYALLGGTKAWKDAGYPMEKSETK